MKTIELNNGMSAMVDDEDFEYLSKFNWRCETNRPGNLYAVTGVSKPKRRTIRMHQLVLKAAEVDHKDGNGLNNTKDNLRSCSDSQQRANQKVRIDCKSGYKGVGMVRHTKKFPVKFRGKHIGYFGTIVEAANAYNVAAKQFFGDFARLNPIT